LERYERYSGQRILLDSQTRTELERLSARFTPRFVAHLSIGVTVIILAVGVLVFLNSLGHRFFPIILLLLSIGFAVFLFIPAGMMKHSHDMLLGHGDYINRAAYRKMERIIATLSSVYWPLMVAIYLFWSFIGNAWSKSWMLWPVAGVVFGAICGGVGAWYSMKDD